MEVFAFWMTVDLKVPRSERGNEIILPGRLAPPALLVRLSSAVL
jgi:hypothetical protein